MRLRYRLLLSVLLLLGVPFYWLLVDNHAIGVPAVRFDLAEMRRLAEAIPGAKPKRVLVQKVATRRVPGALLVAGGGLQPNTLAVLSYLVSGGDPGDIVIDSGLSAAEARSLGFSSYSRTGQARVDLAMRGAALIVFTHEHLDHIGGFLQLPDFAAIARKALVTPEQFAASGSAEPLRWPRGAKAIVRRFAYRGMAPVAPGVVLIRTPGHTPGSQMIFVRLAGGREYLFAGDTATMGRSWQWVRGRSRLLADYLAPEDRAAVLGWLRALRELKRQAPGLVIVPGHDIDELSDPQRPTGIGHGFPPGAPTPFSARLPGG